MAGCGGDGSGAPADDVSGGLFADIETGGDVDWFSDGLLTPPDDWASMPDAAGDGGFGGGWGADGGASVEVTGSPEQDVGRPDGPTLEPGPDVVEAEPAEPVPVGVSASVSPVRRLTRREWRDTTADLLGYAGDASELLPADPESLGFDNAAAAQTVSPLHVERWLQAAEIVATELAADVDALLPCDPGEDGVFDCGSEFIERFGRRAQRRPLSSKQRDLYINLFVNALDAWGFDASIRLVLEAMLLSPHFLYRVELGLPETETDGVVRLTPHEMAARLSYTLWGSMPDPELDALADAGHLVTPESVDEQAVRMLGDVRARRLVDHFHRQWLRLDRLPLLANFLPLHADYRNETRQFVEHAIFEGAGTLEELFTADYTFVTSQLAPTYGATFSGAWTKTKLADTELDFRKVELDAGQRAGLLTQASFLSIQASAPSPARSIIRRGLFVRESLLCDPPPPPPDDVPMDLPTVDESDLTPPEMLAQHVAPECAGCHSLMDPIGLAFEHYSHAGAWRDEYEGGQPIEALGELLGTDVDGPVDGAVELAGVLAGSDQAADCYARQWWRFTHGRMVGPDDTASFDALVAEFSADGAVLEMLRSVTASDAFLYLPVGDDE